VRATEHAPRDPFRVRERGHGLIGLKNPIFLTHKNTLSTRTL
jgi:hypothetical protein